MSDLHKLILPLGLLLIVGCSTDKGTRVVTVREPEAIPGEIKELDALRQEVEERTTWGRGETKPWNERYEGENSGQPFQGPEKSYNRRPAPLLSN